MRTSYTKKLNLSEKFCKLYSTLAISFLLAFSMSNVFNFTSNSSATTCENGTVSGASASDICDTSTTDVNVSISGAWTVSVSSSGTLGLNLTPSSSGVLSTVTDNVNIYANTPSGYQLYLNSTSGNTDIYNSTDTSQELNHFTATTGTKSSPTTLTNNTWGYSLSSSPTTFSKVELTSSSADSLISSGSKTTGAGDNLPVTYGFMADTKLTPGTYSTQVTYTAIAEAPSYTLTSVSPNELRINDQTAKTIIIMTSTPTSELGLGDITASITNGVNTVNLTDCTEITAEVSSTSYRGAACSYTGNLPVGTYNVTLTSSWHSATYVLPNSFTIYKTIQDITYMQEMTTDICNRMSKNQTATLQDPRGSYNTTTPANYGIIKAKDGNCWMTDNLNLYNRQISNVDSDLPVNTTILLPDTSNWTGNTPSSMKIHRGVGTGYSNYVYYNWCAVVGLSSTCSTSEQQNQSICPKNWQLPINGNEDADKTYAKLLKAYSITNGTELIANTILGFKSEGYYDAVYGLDMLAYGVNGQGWTSTPSIDGQSAYYLLYWHSENNNSVTPQYLNYKDFAFATRCVAR